MACGLCCDGTIFSEVPLHSDAEAGRLVARGIEIFQDRKPAALRQPCAAYKNCACSIYAERPDKCRAFQCILLKRFEANEVSGSDALKIIHDARSLRDEVKRAMPTDFDDRGGPLPGLTPRLMSKWKDTASIDARDQVSEIFGKFAALWLCINRNFRDGWLA